MQGGSTGGCQLSLYVLAMVPKLACLLFAPRGQSSSRSLETATHITRQHPTTSPHSRASLQAHNSLIMLPAAANLASRLALSSAVRVPLPRRLPFPIRARLHRDLSLPLRRPPPPCACSRLRSVSSLLRCVRGELGAGGQVPTRPTFSTSSSAPSPPVQSNSADYAKFAGDAERSHVVVSWLDGRAIAGRSGSTSSATEASNRPMQTRPTRSACSGPRRSTRPCPRSIPSCSTLSRGRRTDNTR
jgi:hypothetical protein